MNYSFVSRIRTGVHLTNLHELHYILILFTEFQKIGIDAQHSNVLADWGRES